MLFFLLYFCKRKTCINEYVKITQPNKTNFFSVFLRFINIFIISAMFLGKNSLIFSYYIYPYSLSSKYFCIFSALPFITIWCGFLWFNKESIAISIICSFIPFSLFTPFLFSSMVKVPVKNDCWLC